MAPTNATFEAEEGIFSEYGCSGRWTPANHWLFQLAHCSIFLSFLAPHTVYGHMWLHGTLIGGFLMLTIWAWGAICAPDIFSWNLCFSVIEAVQLGYLVYMVRPVKFHPEIEGIYKALFEPLQVPRYLFRKLVKEDRCSVINLKEGEHYAIANITQADRLGLLIHGTADVRNRDKILHHVKENEFLDSPEFESDIQDDMFHVDIVAQSMCRYIFWQRDVLQSLFTKEPYLATVMGSLIGRDITNKLYFLEETMRRGGARTDIRLPSLSGSDSVSPSYKTSKEQVGPVFAYASKETIGEEDENEEVTEKTRMFPNGPAADPKA